MHLEFLTEVHIRDLVGDVTVQTVQDLTGVKWYTDAPLVAKICGPGGRRLELLPNRATQATGQVTLTVAPGTWVFQD